MTRIIAVPGMTKGPGQCSASALGSRTQSSSASLGDHWHHTAETTAGSRSSPCRLCSPSAAPAVHATMLISCTIAAFNVLYPERHAGGMLFPYSSKRHPSMCRPTQSFQSCHVMAMSNVGILKPSIVPGAEHDPALGHDMSRRLWPIPA